MTPEQYQQLIDAVKTQNAIQDYILFFLLIGIGIQLFRIFCLGKNNRNFL